MFSLVAVLLLVGTIANGVYLADMERSLANDDGNPCFQDFTAVIEGERRLIERMASETLLAVRQKVYSQATDESARALWNLNRLFSFEFRKVIKTHYENRKTADGSLVISARDVDVSLSAVPLGYTTLNPFGMSVEMSFASAVRVSGTVNLTLSRMKGGPEWGQVAKIEFQIVMDDPHVLTAELLARLGLELSGEGFVSMAAERMLEQEISNRFYKFRNYSPVMNGPSFYNDVRYAVECAIELELMSLFHAASQQKFRALLGNPRVEAIAADHGMDEFNFTAPPEGDELAIGLGILRTGVTPVGNGDVPGPAGPLYYTVDCRWVEHPAISIDNIVYAGEEELFDFDVWNIRLTGAYCIAVGDQNYRLSPPVLVTLPVKMDLRVHHAETSDIGRARHGVNHPQVENISLFASEALYAYHQRGDVRLVLADENGELPFRDGEVVSSEMLFDSVPCGVFRNVPGGNGAVAFFNVPGGPHTVECVATLKDGRILRGTVEYGQSQEPMLVNIPLSEQSSPFGLWPILLAHLRGTSGQMRAVETLRFFGELLGYPVPQNIIDIDDNGTEDVRALLDWGRGLDGYANSLMDAGGAPAALPGNDLHQLVSLLELDLQVIGAIQELQDTCTKYLSQFGNLSKLLRTPGKGAVFDINGMSLSFVWKKNGQKKISFSFEADLFTTKFELRKSGDGRPWRMSPLNIPFVKNGKPGENPRLEEQFEWAFKPPDSTLSEIELDIGSLGDILGIANLALGLFFDSARYQTEDETGVQVSDIDLQVGLAELMLKVCAFIANRVAPVMFGASGTAVTAGVKAARVGGQVVGLFSGVLELFCLYREEAEKYDNDPYAWTALLTGFDKETLEFYVALSSLMVSLVSTAAYVIAAFGTVQTAYCIAATFTAFFGPAGWMLALPLFAFSVAAGIEGARAFLTRTLSDDEEATLKSMAVSTLSSTIGIVAKLNSMHPDQIAQSARNNRGASYNLARLCMLTGDERMSYELHNISASYADLGAAKLEQARAIRSARFSLISLWKQIDDLHDDDVDARESSEEGDRHAFTDRGTLRDHDFSGDIVVSDPSRDWKKKTLRQEEIEDYLLCLTEENALQVTVDYSLFKDLWLVSDGVSEWMRTLAPICSRTAHELGELSRAASLCAYVTLLPSSVYAPEWGFLQLQGCPPYKEMKFRIASLDGPCFRYLDGRVEKSSDNELEVVMRNISSPLNLYVEQGNYSVNCVETIPVIDALKTKTVKARATMPSDPEFGTRNARFVQRPSKVSFSVESLCNSSAQLDAFIYDIEGNLLGTVVNNVPFNNTSRELRQVALDEKWIDKNYEDVTGETSSYYDEGESGYNLLRFIYRIYRDNGTGFDDYAMLNISLGFVRSDQKLAMALQGGKPDNQLEYCLTLYDDYVLIKDNEGTVSRTLLGWERVTRLR